MLVRVVAITALAGLAGVGSVGTAGRPASDATAVVSGHGTSYVLTVTNTGVLPISCMRFRPRYGVQITSTDGESLERNTIGTAGPDPGKTSRTRFRTKRPYPARTGGELQLNNPSFKNTCVFPGRTVRVTGPAKS